MEISVLAILESPAHKQGVLCLSVRSAGEKATQFTSTKFEPNKYINKANKNKFDKKDFLNLENQSSFCKNKLGYIQNVQIKFV